LGEKLINKSNQKNRKKNGFIFSLRSKLTLSYMLIVVFVVGLISLLANTSIRTQFQKYVIDRREQQTAEIIELIKLRYKEGTEWDISYLEIVGMNALQKGMIIEISDVNNKEIWSAYEHNNGLCQSMISTIRSNMNSYSGSWKGDYQEKDYVIYSNNKKIGVLKTGFVGPYYFNNQELIFIKALNTIFLFIGSLSLLLAFILGLIMSLRISKPLNKIAQKASSLSEGNYKERLNKESNTKEIGILSETINNLSDALENKENLRKQLTQDVAHELRTPLTSVQGHMEAMLDGIWPMDEERLSSCYDEIIRIKRLIGSIEDLSRVENDNVILHKEEIELSRLFTRILNNFENDILQKNITLNYNSERVLFFADEDKICQVLNNLISNAIKYSDEGDKIFIEVSEEDKNVLIRIKDTGIGIDEENLPFIFERFYRADKSRSRETGGIGIGLTITKSIIEAHGGSIHVASKLGEGTEFSVKIPKNI
jgi:signal transduction histidine kinase